MSDEFFDWSSQDVWAHGAWADGAFLNGAFFHNAWGPARLPARAINLKNAHAMYGGKISHTVAMASPPTIVTGASVWNGLPGITGEHDYRDETVNPFVRYFGGGDKDYSHFRRFPVATYAATGGSLEDGQNAMVFRVETYTDAPTFVFYILTGAKYRLLVDDKYVSLIGSDIGTGGGTGVALEFGSRALRKIALEGSFADGFYGIGFAPGDIVQQSVRDPLARMIVVGDSFTASTGATVPADGFGQIIGDALGVADVWLSGVGATGYVAKGVGDASYNLTERLDDVNAHGPWDAIVVAMGFNDKGVATATIKANVAACLGSFRTNNPDSVIFVVGPWDDGAPDANLAPTKAAIRSGAKGIAGCYFIDVDGVSYSKSDAVHPDTAGHLTIGNYIVGKMMDVLWSATERFAGAT